MKNMLDAVLDTACDVQCCGHSSSASGEHLCKPHYRSDKALKQVRCYGHKEVASMVCAKYYFPSHLHPC